MTIFSSVFSAQLCYKVLHTGPHAACPQNTESLFYSAELFYSRGTFLPWDRRRRAPPRCHSHHPHPPGEGLGAALPQTRVRARYCCWDRDLYRISLTRSRKPLNWQAQTQRNTTCFVPRQSNAIISDLGCYRAFAERNMFSSCFAPSPSSFFQRNREHAVLAAEKRSGRRSHLPKRAISIPKRVAGICRGRWSDRRAPRAAPTRSKTRSSSH